MVCRAQSSEPKCNIYKRINFFNILYLLYNVKMVLAMCNKRGHFWIGLIGFSATIHHFVPFSTFPILPIHVRFSNKGFVRYCVTYLECCISWLKWLSNILNYWYKVINHFAESWSPTQNAYALLSSSISKYHNLALNCYVLQNGGIRGGYHSSDLKWPSSMRSFEEPLANCTQKVFRFSSGIPDMSPINYQPCRPTIAWEQIQWNFLISLRKNTLNERKRTFLTRFLLLWNFY